MHIAIFRHFVFLMLLPVHTFILHSSFLQFLTFPIPGRSIIIALSGDVQPKIKAPFPYIYIRLIASGIDKIHNCPKCLKEKHFQKFR